MTTEADIQTRVVAARLEEGIVRRLERAAAADQRSLGNAMKKLVLRGLDEYEREVLGSSQVGAPAAAPEEVAS